MKTDYVTYLVGASNYTWTHYESGEKYMTAQTLKHLETVFPTYLRIHKSYLVNPDSIRKVVVFAHGLAGAVVLKDGKSLPVSRRRWPIIQKRLAATVRIVPLL